MKNQKRRVQVQKDVENDPPIKIEKTTEKKKQVQEYSQNIHKIQFSLRQESKKHTSIICVKNISDSSSLKPQKKICLQHYDDIRFFNRNPLKGSRIPQKQITLGQINSFIVGYDSKIYNFLDKNINNGMLIGLQKQQKKHEEIIKQKVVPKVITCNCKKSKCLKLYCECFSLEEVCSERCQCQGCHNAETNHKERQQAVKLLKSRNPSAFEKKGAIEEEDSALAIKYSRGCNCKKSGCQKKYCECYQLGLKCSESCKCKNCKNMEYTMKLIDIDQQNKQSSHFGSFSKLLQ